MLRNNYGAWTLCSDQLSERSHVFSVGIGTDASFDVAIAKRHGARVSCFDPTINQRQFEKAVVRATRHDQHRAHSLLRFYPFGLGAEDSVLAFYRRNHSNENGSLVSTPGLPNYVQRVWLHAPVLRVQTLQHIAQVPRIDVLKLDIEGAEWRVFHRNNTDLREWLRCSPPSQIAIEFHDRFFDQLDRLRPRQRRARVYRLLKRCGYTRRHWSLPAKEEVLFVRDHVASADC